MRPAPTLGYVAVYAGLLLAATYSAARIPAVTFSLVLLGIHYAVTRSPRTLAIVFARRRFIAIALLLLTALVGFWLSAGAVNYPDGPIALKELVAGFVLGVFVRIIVSSILAPARFGRSNYSRELSLVFTTTLILIAAPAEQGSAGVYVIGLGLGLAVHFMIRDVHHRIAEASRRLAQLLLILSAGRPRPDVPDDSDESLVLTAFREQNWKAIDRLVRGENLSPVLSVVKAYRLRMLGRYGDLQCFIQTEIRRAHLSADELRRLRILMAVNLGELNERRQMFALLEELAKASPECVTVLWTLGLRLAEELPLQTPFEPSCAEHRPAAELARRHVSEALALYEARQPTPRVAVLRQAVALNHTSLLDALAYTALKLGRYTEAEALLRSCIRDDPLLSSAWLHLGELHYAQFLRAAFHEQDDLLDWSSTKWTASYCAHVALAFEGAQRQDSLTSRRSRALLQQIAAADRLGGVAFDQVIFL